LRGFAEHTIPWLYLTFAVTVVTGVALFLYDPLNVGSHAYFTLKLLFILLGLVNALAFHRWSLGGALKAETTMPRSAKVGGAISLGLWILVMLAASLNVEGAPKVLLSGGADTAVSQ
jgi:dipeptide/tripeptide permease